MEKRQIPFGRPMMDQAEKDAVLKVLSGPILVHGPVTHEFETKFAERIGTKHAIALSSCTAGLHMVLFAKEIGPGDEVIVPAMTHVATAHAVEFCGAKPVFVDVEDDTGNIDPAAMASVAGGKTRAAMVVHYLGLPCDMDRIDPIMKKVGGFVVEDCALAIDATYGGRKAGQLGLAGCFSFYPVKHMTTLEGGMVSTDDPKLSAAIAQRKAFGYDRTITERKMPGIYDVTELGYNYRMNEVESAVGLAQLAKLDAFQASRQRNFQIIKAALDEIDELTIFEPTKGKATSSHYCLNATLPKDGRLDRPTIVNQLSAMGVGTSVHYPSAVPLMSYYRKKYGYRDGMFPIAEWIASQTISFPVGPHVSEEDARYIGAAVKEAIVKTKR